MPCTSSTDWRTTAWTRHTYYNYMKHIKDKFGVNYDIIATEFVNKWFWAVLATRRFAPVAPSLFGSTLVLLLRHMQTLHYSPIHGDFLYHLHQFHHQQLGVLVRQLSEQIVIWTHFGAIAVYLVYIDELNCKSAHIQQALICFIIANASIIGFSLNFTVLSLLGVIVPNYC